MANTGVEGGRRRPRIIKDVVYRHGRPESGGHGSSGVATAHAGEHGQTAKSLHDFLLGQDLFRFEFDGRPASVEIQRRDDKSYPFGSEVKTQFTNWKGDVEVRRYSSMNLTSEDAISSIPIHIRPIVEKASASQRGAR